MFMVAMKSFSSEDISMLLYCCGKSLAEAYQLTLKEELWRYSAMAFEASEYLIYVIQKQNNKHWIH